MAFIADNFAESSGTNAVSTSVAATGSNRYAVAFIYAEGGVTIPGNVTYGGVNMLPISGANLNSTMGGICQVFGLESPATGTQTVTATFSGTSGRCMIYVMVWDSINSSGNGNATAGEVASSSLDISTTAGDEAISFCVCASDTITMGGSGQTNREEQDDWGSTFRSFGSASKTASTTTTSLVWTPGSTTDVFQVGLRLTPLASGYTLTSDSGAFTMSGKEASLTYSNAGGGTTQFGRTTQGASWQEIEQDIQGRLITLPGGQPIASTKAYLQTTNGVTANVKSALVNSSTDTVAYESSQLSFTDDTGGWKTITWPATTPAAGTYYLVISSDGISGGLNTVNIAHDTVTGTTDLKRASAATGGSQSTYPAFPVGAITWDGSTHDQDVSIYLETVGGLSLNAEGTSYTQSGKDASFVYTRRLTADAGAFALVGSEAYRDIEIDSEVGAFALGSGTTNLGHGRIMTASGTSFSMSGKDVIFNYSAAGPRTLIADHTTFSMAGQDAILRLGKALIAEHGQYFFVGNSVVGGTPIDRSTDASGPFRIRHALVVSATGRTKWIHYIPVQQVEPAAEDIGTFDNTGAIEVKLVGDPTGMTEWEDYIPIVEVADGEAGKWRYDNSGWIPILFVE
jgi:hypothetical protein